MSSSKYGKGSSSSASRNLTFFVPGNGIDREVISTDICRYLGNDATAKPGEYTDTKTGVTTRGFYVTAYRALTTEQIADIKADSIRWAKEKQQPTSRGQTSGDGYRQSATRRQQWNDPPESYATSRDAQRQMPQNISAGRGFESSSSGPYTAGQKDSAYGAESNSSYKIASFYEAQPPSQPRSAHPAQYGSGVSTSRGQGQQGYSYTTAGAPQVQGAYSYAPSPGVSSLQQTSFLPRETSPQQPQYVDRGDEEMDDYYDDYPQEAPNPSTYGRPSTRDPDPPRREDRDRHRDSRHRRH